MFNKSKIIQLMTQIESIRGKEQMLLWSIILIHIEIIIVCGRYKRSVRKKVSSWSIAVNGWTYCVTEFFSQNKMRKNPDTIGTASEYKDVYNSRIIEHSQHSFFVFAKVYSHLLLFILHLNCFFFFFSFLE